MNLFNRCLRVLYQNANKPNLLRPVPGPAVMEVRLFFRPQALSPKPLPPVPNIEELPQFGTYSPSVCQFIAERQYENQNSKIKSWVTPFLAENPVGMIQLNEFVFGENPRIDILHRVVVWQRAKRRAGTACVKTRAEKRGGGRKPWPQKGLGKARQGSIRAPHWRGGGVCHGPKPKSYDYTLPKKVRRMGLRVALSVRYAQGDLHIVESFDDCDDEKDLLPVLEKRGWKSAVLVDGMINPNLIEATKNLEKVDAFHALNVNVYSILLRHNLVLSLDAVKLLEERLAEDSRILENQFD